MADVYCCKYVWTDSADNKKYSLYKCNTVEKCSDTVTELGHTWALDKQTRAKDCAHCWPARELPSSELARELNEIRIRLAEIQGRLSVLSRMDSETEAVIAVGAVSNANKETTKKRRGKTSSEGPVL